MTLREYFATRETWLRQHRHPKTVNETRVAVEAFCEWLARDIDIDDVTPQLVDQFEADKESSRRRQLVSNLCGLLRLYDDKSFPRRYKTTFALAMMRRDVVMEPRKRSNGKPRTLSEFAALYVSQRTLSASYANTIVKRAAQYEQWHGATTVAELFTEDALNAFLTALDGTGSTWTIAKWRQDLLTLWASAADDDLCEYPRRRRIRKPKRDAVSVECYTPDEIRALVAAAERLRGCFDNGVARRYYWSALIRFAWDSGLRRGDCWRWERASLQDDGTFRVTQHKTRKPIRRMLRPATLAAIDKIDSPTPLAWPLNNEWSFGFQFQRIIAEAGLERGSFKWLRRATGSHVEAEHPGAGHRALGNTTQIFNSHYNADLAGEILLPPAL